MTAYDTRGNCYLDVFTVHTCSDPFLEGLKSRQDDSMWLIGDKYNETAFTVHTRVDKRNKGRSRPV